MIKFLLVNTLVATVAEAKTRRLLVQSVGLLVDTRLDPLVNPDSCSSHVHSVYGNSQFGASVRRLLFEDDNWRDIIGKEDQTKSEVIPNLSMYWGKFLWVFKGCYNMDPVVCLPFIPDTIVPPLLWLVPSLYIVKNGVYHIGSSYARAYYRITYRPEQTSPIHPFPPFLQMIVGNATRHEPFQDHEMDRDDIRWTLMKTNRGNTNYLDHGDWSYMKNRANDVASVTHVEMNINFPECLRVRPDGSPRNKSPNFRDHATYAVSNVWDHERSSFCPTSHPYQIPQLNLQVRFDLRPLRNLLGGDVVNNVDNWRLSTGDASGAGAHADFINGWPEDLMRNMIANCSFGTSIAPGIQDCILDEYAINGTIKESVPMVNPIPNEAITNVTNLPTGACPPGFPPPRRGLRYK